MAEKDVAGQKPRPVVIVRKERGHRGRHESAWKVAYADFVTAMMALFIVLWLMGADEDTKHNIASYFRNPSGSVEVPREDMQDLREKIRKALATLPNFRNLKDHVDITLTSDGLRIELLESEAGMFFESGKPLPTATGEELLTRLAGELRHLPNAILIEGHTDSRPYAGDGPYTNWELSADRANAARRLMQAHGLRPEQIGQVRGYADRDLRRPEEPDSPSNRRISVIVQYMPVERH